MIILLWAYYSSQILFFGAEFTQVYAKSYGTRIQPAENAQAGDGGSARHSKVYPVKGRLLRPDDDNVTMPVEELLTRWTIRIALLHYVASVGALTASLASAGVTPRGAAGMDGGLRISLAAYGRGFSLLSRAGVTGPRTRRRRRILKSSLDGRSASGVYFNYLFAAVWTADVWSWWCSDIALPLSRARWLHWVVHGFLLFMVFNATVTFGEGDLRWVAAVMFLVLLGIAVYARRYSK